jgi:hypothetical protein
MRSNRPLRSASPASGGLLRPSCRWQLLHERAWNSGPSPSSPRALAGAAIQLAPIGGGEQRRREPERPCARVGYGARTTERTEWLLRRSERRGDDGHECDAARPEDVHGQSPGRSGSS